MTSKPPIPTVQWRVYILLVAILLGAIIAAGWW